MKRRLTVEEHYRLARQLAQLDVDVRAIGHELAGVPVAFTDQLGRIGHAVSEFKCYADSLLFAQHPGQDLPSPYYGPDARVQR